MSEHRATVLWTHTRGEFLKGTYSREHTWSFDGGVTVPASPAPTSVRPPYCNPDNVDPEEAFVAAISSCHMLTFLYLAYKDGIEVTSYEDEAVGEMTKNEKGALWVSRVTLRPRIHYAGGRAPAADRLERLHHAAHEECYISNSVKTEVVVTPVEG